MSKIRLLFYKYRNMQLKVYSKETTLIETIDIKDIDLTKHFHRNTHKTFTKEELEEYGYKLIEKPLKPLNKLNKTELLEKVSELWIEWVKEETTNKEIVGLIEKATK